MEFFLNRMSGCGIYLAVDTIDFFKWRPAINTSSIINSFIIFAFFVKIEQMSGKQSQTMNN